MNAGIETNMTTAPTATTVPAAVATIQTGSSDARVIADKAAVKQQQQQPVKTVGEEKKKKPWYKRFKLQQATYCRCGTM